MNIREIAKLAGVSASTVSKVMNNKAENISPETKARILKIAREYNYVPYSSIRNAPATKTYTIAVLLRDFLATGKFIQGVLQAAAEYGYSILLYDSANSEEAELKYISAICRLNADGVLWEPVGRDSLANSKYFEQAGVPITYVGDPDIQGSMFVDIRHMAYICTKKLIDNMHHHIGCLLMSDLSVSRDVERGFKDCLYDHEIVFKDSMVQYVKADEPLADVISLKDTAFICSDLTLAISLHEHLESLHYRIPDDYSIITIEQDIRGAYKGLDLTSSVIPYLELGYYSCSSMIKTLEGVRSKKALLMPTEYEITPGSSVGISRDYRRKKILIAGDINMNHNFIVDELLPAGEITPIKRISNSVGGRGCNQAVACTRLGQDVILIGKIGNDSDATDIIDILNSSGVDTEGIVRESNSPSGKAYIYMPHNGESSYTVLSGANSLVDSKYISSVQDLFRNAGYCIISSEFSKDTVLTFLRIAKQNGATTILKPINEEKITKSLAGYVDYLIPDRKQAAKLCPSSKTPTAQAKALRKLGIPNVIITLGEDGCCISSDALTKTFPAAKFSVVDRNGGSDAFISSFASFMNDGYDLESSIKLAQYSAGFCISLQGTFSAFVDQNTLFALVEKNEPDLLKKI